MPHSIGSHSSEGAPTGVDPEAVRRTIVIGDDQIRKPVAVEIPKLNAQSPVPRRVHWFSLIIQKGPRDVGQQREVATAIVAVQAIGLGQLHNLALRPHLEATQPARMSRRLPIHLRNARNTPFAGDAHLHCRVCQSDHVAVVGAVQVEVAIPIDVSQSHRHGRGRSRQP